MLGFEDSTEEIDEKRSERMNFRTQPRIKKAIQRAAALAGVDDSVFTMSAAYAAAQDVIAAHENTTLDPIDHAAFFEALDGPNEPTEALRAAFETHERRVNSK